jgi:transforming growth factor-beta-induced protein
MRTINYFKKVRVVITALVFAGSASVSFAQTNVFDNVIATSPNHTYLEAALIQEGLDVALKNPNATLTVFAPDNAAFDALAAALNTNIAGLLANPDLTNILLYHVLGATVPSSAVTNGAIVTPLNNANTIKMTKTSTGSVYANQAMVNAADLTAANGVVHSVNGVLLPVETVVDIALDNGFTTLATAVVTAELLPALTNPLATLTVFAPTNAAFDALLTALGIDVNTLLASPDLANYLTYHVLGATVPASAVTNGAVVSPLSTTNTLKLTKTSTGSVYVNQAMVTTADLNAANGVVHVINAVVLPFETVVDVAIDNGFTTLTAAVVKAELLPALTNPFTQLTVFAPTNTAFDNLATALGTDLNGILALPNLADVLLYHVVAGTVLSTDLTNGPVATLNGQNIIVDLTAGVKINDANVTLADVTAFNGVVHVIDAVLLPAASLTDLPEENISVYPNPAISTIQLPAVEGNYEIVSTTGNLVRKGNTSESVLNVENLEKGMYILRVTNNQGELRTNFIKQ